MTLHFPHEDLFKAFHSVSVLVPQPAGVSLHAVPHSQHLCLEASAHLLLPVPRPHMSLRGKVIAITGATSGNALQLARLAASRGAKLALADTHSLALDDLVTEIRSHGIEAVGTVVDVASSQQVDDWINSTVNHFGTLDAAANLAAVEDLNKKNMTASLADVGNEEWNQIMLELAGVMYCVRAQIRVMGAGASIVNALDVRGLTGRTRAAAYSTLQHGVVGLTKSVAKEVGPKGIRVNAVAM